ncbi:MAG: RNase adapter RapZ [Actinomycetota bacterium]
MNASVPELTLVTGMSGAGRTAAADALEDLGFFVVDNLPPALIGRVIDLAQGGDHPQRLAFVTDVRGGSYFEQMHGALRELGERGLSYRIVYLEARDEVLLRGYEGCKRKHPMADRVMEGIALERDALRSIREIADLVIDTSDLSVHQLRERIVSAFASQSREERLRTNVVSFGFKHGLPVDADIVLDVRFLPNPYWVDELRPFNGKDEVIQRYVMDAPAAKEFLDRLEGLLDVLVPGWLEEGKRFQTIAIGCTGGRHRSVVIAEQVAEQLRERGLPVSIRHRDLERGA